jgi:superfamily II DNA or RNA helicase
MSKLELPVVKRQVFNHRKNSIQQLIEEASSVDIDHIEVANGHTIVRSGETAYYLTRTKDTYPEDQEYILVCDKKPTEQRIRESQLNLQWARHPKLDNYTTQDVIESWYQDFHYIEEDLQKEQQGLRLPQIGALHSILSHLKVSDDIGTVVMPTGTGKTETMLSALVANQCNKLLVTVPSDALRDQLSNKFYTFGLLKSFGVIGEKSLRPIVGIVKQKFENVEELERFFEKCNVIVTTMSIAAGSLIDHQQKMAQLCSHLFIDEAHHVKAGSWDTFRKRFENQKVLQFTATPFRNDQKRLDGKIIFNFPLKKAQEQGYFKKIDLIPIRVYDPEEADKKIAEVAVNKLRKNRDQGLPHILMARCRNRHRANAIFELYQEYEEFSPVVIHTGVLEKQSVLEAIKNKEHQIIVCVDMLGEGFDLPELKIAAFHDIKKSLPITLQFAGRFTRSKYDEELGNASFIVNLADTDVKDELSELYAQDADWNLLLSSLSDEEIQEKIEYADFIAGFRNLEKSDIPFQNIRIPLSAVVYKNHSANWRPERFEFGIQNYDKFDYKFHDLNDEYKLLVVITAEKQYLDWGEIKDIYHLEWHITAIYYDTETKLLFIHGSDKSKLYSELATSILGDDAELIRGINVFKAFYDIKRVSLKNVGLKEFLGKHIRFRMSVGSDVEEALSMEEKKKGQKAFVFGTGYEEGAKVSLGCSYKGRVWSYMRDDLRQFTEWSHHIAQKLSNPDIDANQVLQETLIPSLIVVRPENKWPVWVDWYYEMYSDSETKFTFEIDGHPYGFFDCELQICDASLNGDLYFEIVAYDERVKFKLTLFESTQADGTKVPDFSISNMSSKTVIISFGRQSLDVETFFVKYVPTIWFADGSSLTGNEFVELKQIIQPYSVDELIDDWDWDGVDLSKEAQKVNPKETDSIQYRVIERLKTEDFDVIYDDDGSGEIADIVAIKVESDFIKICLYHLKYAKEGKISNQVGNFYEVCGQAQKSIHWKHKSGDALIGHLLRRLTKKWAGSECSRLEKGSSEDLEKLLRITKKQMPVEYINYIVQPGASSNNISDEILTLLGVTENYLMEYGKIPLRVVVNQGVGQ